MIGRRTECAWLFLVVVSVQLGCDSGPSSGKLQGKVIYRGQALDHGMVSFFPATGRPIGSAISPDGTYSVELAPGSYSVVVIAPPKLPEGFKEGDPLPPPDPNALPAKFNRKETSGLTASVDADGELQTIDFEMK
jgi:hypothetical protein